MENLLARLHRFIIDHYDREELRTLCFDLRVNYDALPGEGTAAKARELILYLGRREELERLLGALRRPPGESWDAAALYAALPAFEASDAPTERAVHTEGGAYVEGGVDTGGGDFVGRDKHVHGDEVHWDTIVNVYGRAQTEDFREKELGYLDRLLEQYAYWEQHYTPLAGIAEVRSAVRGGLRIDLPVPFIPPGFKKLVEHGYGERCDIKRVSVGDIREAVTEHQRIILLGDPGSGKTTTLWRLAYEYAQAALRDENAPLPVFVPLGGYTDASPFDVCLARHLGPLGEHLEVYSAADRLALLLDGLNEMPREGYAGRVGRIRYFLDWHPHGPAVVTCRALDYVEELERLQKVEISPLDEERIRAFLDNYLGEEAGERCFRTMVNEGEVRGPWAMESPWSMDKVSRKKDKGELYGKQRWSHLYRDSPSLLELGRNPYMLLMTAQVYASAEGELPVNRAQMFAAFVNTLLDRERKRHTTRWIEANRIQDGLAALAYEMQVEGEQGTTVEQSWALERLGRVAPDCDAGQVLYLAASATLLNIDEDKLRFYHQLLQEYFAARELGRRFAAGETLSRFWTSNRWWEPSGWEETTILLAGMEPDASELLRKMAEVNPLLAARCLLESGVQTSDAARRDIVGMLTTTLEHGVSKVRKAAAEALGKIGGADAVEPLIKTLLHEDSWTRDAAIEALVKVGAPAVERLVAGLGVRNSNLRQRIVEVLGKIGGARAVQSLIASLRDEDVRVRQRAAEALDTLNWQPGSGRIAAIYWIAKQEWNRCVEIGEPAVVPLIAALRNEDWRIRRGVASALREIGAPAVKPLIVALQDRDSNVRQRVAEALGQIGEPAMERLTVALREGDNDTRRRVVEALDRLKWKPSDDEIGATYWIVKQEWDKCVKTGLLAVRPLVAALQDQDGDSNVRQGAVKALGQIGDARVIEPLIVALQDRDSNVRQRVAEALGQIGELAMKHLTAALKHGDNNTRWRVAEALGQIGEPAMELLIAALRDRDWQVRERAAGSLGKINNSRAVAPLNVALRDKRKLVRRRAAESLVGIGAPAADSLVAALRDRDSDVRQRATEALGQIGEPAVEPLSAALQDDDSDVRQSAARALERIGTPEALAALERWRRKR